MTEARSDAPLVDVRGLEKTFPNGTRALQDITLEINRPGIFGIVGPDGAGKTTLLRALVGILEFRAERLAVLGHVLPRDAQALKAEVGYVPQIWGLYPDLSVKENLQFFAAIRRIPENEFNERKRVLLKATDLTLFEDRLAGQLSGGMKQKLAISCTLLHRPRLLILDEPNNGVDVSARHEIWDLISRDAEHSVIISTNYVEEAAMCDELIYLIQGRVVARGTPDAILQDHAAEIHQYRLHGQNLAPLAAALASESWLVSAQFLGNAVEIETGGNMPIDEIERRVRAHPHGGSRVILVEPRRPDMSSAIRALTREALNHE
ncbi:MAG: ABC transporter ATP-binding protein [Deltaproteobacteria bacterium]|nr:ABC transporter ATP-binding protein [Deltaproteobacteria bacterium]